MATTTSTNRIEVTSRTTSLEDLLTDWADVRAAAAAEAALLTAPRLSDRPAAELPEHEPTADELLAIQWLNDPDVEELIASINLRCALQPGHTLIG